VAETAVDDIVVPIEPVFYEAPPVREVAPAVDTPDAPPPSPAPASTPAPRPPLRWQTRHLVTAAVVALLLGVIIGRIGHSSPSRTSPVKGDRQGAASSDAGATGQPSAGSPAARTPATAATPSSAPATAANGQAVLLSIPRQTGQQITQHFTVATPHWTLGWAYDCSAAPGGTGAFNVKVMDGNGEASTDGGVDQNGAKGSSVVAYTSTGERYLWVTTNCVWAIRVMT